VRRAGRLEARSIGQETVQQAGTSVPFRPSWLQPRDPCEEFQELMCLVSLRPIRSWWPTMADPLLLFVQFPQVVLTELAEKN
jgi:hypothetical protein